MEQKPLILGCLTLAEAKLDAPWLVGNHLLLDGVLAREETESIFRLGRKSKSFCVASGMGKAMG